MDWLIDPSDADSGSARALALLEEHLTRHAVDPATVGPALAGLPDELGRAARDAAGRPLHLRLDWTTTTRYNGIRAVRVKFGAVKAKSSRITPYRQTYAGKPAWQGV